MLSGSILDEEEHAVVLSGFLKCTKCMEKEIRIQSLRSMFVILNRKLFSMQCLDYATFGVLSSRIN